MSFINRIIYEQIIPSAKSTTPRTITLDFRSNFKAKKAPYLRFFTASQIHTMAPQYAKDQPSGFKNHIENVAVVGVSGSVGGYITQALLGTGKHTVTAVTREGSNSEIPKGAKVAKVNYDEENTLVEALKGQQALVITMKTGQVEASLKLVRAAAKAGVQWIMPNEYSPDVRANKSFGYESLLLKNVEAHQVEIEKQGVSSWIALTCSFWYPFSLAQSPHAYGFDFQNKKAYFIDGGDLKINTSTWNQCGRAVAKLFSLPILPQDENDKSLTVSHWRNEQVHISSFFISQRDMLDSILRVTGEKEADWTIVNENAQERYKEGQELMKQGGANAGKGYLQCMYTRIFYNDGSGQFNDKLDNEKLGLPEESLDEATKEGVELVKSGYNYFTR
jgi:hypothetical protein